MIEMKRVTAPFPIYRGDARSALPAFWDVELAEAARSLGALSKLDGASTTSRESDFLESDAAELWVVDGSDIAAALPWLLHAYGGEFLATANQLEIGAFRVAEDLRSTVNINVQGRGQRYEWHVDSNPLTGLLFATTLTHEDGGTLIFRHDPRAEGLSEFELRIQPEVGALYLYDARQAAHAVAPVTTDRLRISVPMNYYFADRPIERPTDLDHYLYGPS